MILEAEEEGLPMALGAEEPRRWISEWNPQVEQRLKSSTSTAGLTLQNAGNVLTDTCLLLKRRKGT